ncbi:LPS export ABC transporter permease LptF [Catenovulum sp. SM1970]|uniref:LPS export ABC transporter permease LptF n=1 Tax=Marinifaba aquimaris TaxID=2741323 RepID=UPI001574A806|nr:LPS export ABC transporter permease LptF [Marinifaba aquimaris]NTS75551.1 LPS export ABC transporter permease LptF [Marinifaba aquimaris]
MIISRYLFSETFKSQLAVFFVMLTIFSSNALVRVLDDAMEGKLPTDLVAWMLLLNIPPLAGLILPLSLFIGIFLAHGRFYADNEMSVLKACGVSEWFVTRVTLVFALLVAILTALNTVWWGPAAYEKRSEFREKLAADIGLSTLIPGQFQNSSNGKAVIFVHNSENSGSEFDRVFVAQLPQEEARKQRFNIVYSQKGEVVEDSLGDQTLILSDGYRYEGERGKRDYQITEFGSSKMKIKEQEVEEQRRKLSSVSTAELMKRDDLDAIAELQWRIALPLSVPLVALIAVPLARVQPRQGRLAKLAPAFLIYLAYFLLLMAGKSALADGKIPPTIGLWWVHTLVLIYGLYLLINERALGLRIKARLAGRAT